MNRYIRTMKISTPLQLGLVSLIFSVAAIAQVAPGISWKTHRSGHFELIYDASGQALAQHYLNRLPEIEKRLSQVWHHWPEKIAIVISDQTDLTNGFATPVPYPLIYVFPVLPGPLDSISEYHDWALEIVLHETTHILTFEQRRDVIEALHSVFGSIMTPNLYLPRWWLEGIAVDGETRFSDAGRLRSSFQSATSRAFVAENRLSTFNFPEINESGITDFPYGARPYYFGSLVWSQMIADYGEKLIYDLHVRLGGRAPYLITTPTRELADGHDLPELFEHTIKTLTAETQAQLTHLREVPISAEADFPNHFKEAFSPTLSPDHLKLALIGKDEALVRAIAIFERPGPHAPFKFKFMKRFPQNIFTRPVGPSLPHLGKDDAGEQNDDDDGPPGGAVSRLSWSSDSKNLVYDFVEKRDQFHEISDLWSLEIDSRKTTRLTDHQRAREPAPSPNGQLIAYVQLGALQTSLAIWDDSKKTTKIVWKAAGQDRISWPTWLNENEIVFVLRGRTGERLVRLNRANGRVEDILSSFRAVGFPVVTSDHRLYFQARDTGVGNIYLASENLKEAKPLTHVESTLLNFDIDKVNGEILATRLTSQGLRLKTFRVPDKPLPPLPQVTSTFANRYPAVAPPAAPTSESLAHDDTYHPFGDYLLPHYWVPFVLFDDQGVEISLITGGQDPLGKNSYSLGVNYEGAIGDVSYAARFTNQSYWPQLSVIGERDVDYLINTTDKTVSETWLGLVSTEVPQVTPGFELVGGYFDDRETKFDQMDETSGPTLGVQYNRMRLFIDRALSAPDGASYDTYLANIPLFFPSPWSLVQGVRLRLQGKYVDHGVYLSQLTQSNSTENVIQLTPVRHDYLMRGYAPGKFLAKNYMLANVDYSFPIRDVNWGFDHFALFFKKLSGALVGDFAYQDGYVSNEILSSPTYQRVDMNQLFSDYGAELSLTTTVGYSLPLRFILGVYMPTDTTVTNSGARFNLGLTL